ncbi:MAG: hypothetical protein NE327_16975 [Lentisphaeraceae bacterium]|nr:hypothetical protein [Lentisphaeraceae bacterium]
MKPLLIGIFLTLPFLVAAEPSDVNWVSEEEWSSQNKLKNNKILLLYDKQLYESKKVKVFEKYLEKKGFSLSAQNLSERSLSKLSSFDQLWIVDTSYKLRQKTIITDKFASFVRKFLKEGKSLHVITQFNGVDAALLLSKLSTITIDSTAADNHEQIQVSSSLGKSKAVDHEILTGVPLFECTQNSAALAQNNRFYSVANNFRNKSLIAVSKEAQIVYSGFSDQLFHYNQNFRIAFNTALYLSGYRRTDLKKKKILQDEPEDKNDFLKIKKFKNKYKNVSKTEWSALRKPVNNNILVILTDTFNRIPPTLKKHLSKANFTVTFKSILDKPYESLYEYDQLWILSQSRNKFAKKSTIISSERYKKIKEFIEQGKGVYIAADNNPHCYEADFLLEKFMESGISHVESKNHKMKILSKREFKGETLTALEHELYTGLHYLHEGYTVSRIEYSPHLAVIGVGTRGNILCIPKDPNQNVVYDGAYTKLYGGTENPDFIRNLALYLAGYRRGDIEREPYDDSEN